jgi:hypothetical protein
VKLLPETQHGFGFETGTAPLDLKPKPALGFTSAANPVLLPKAKPRALPEPFVVSSIRSREVVPAERSSVRLCEDALKAFDLGNSLLGVHFVSISTVGVAVVNVVASAYRACQSVLHPVPRQVTVDRRAKDMGRGNRFTYLPTESKNALIWVQYLRTM